MPIAEIDYSRISFPEALDYLSEKTNLDTDTYIEGQGIVQDVAFTVAAAKGQLLQDIRDAGDRSPMESRSISFWSGSITSLPATPMIGRSKAVILGVVPSSISKTSVRHIMLVGTLR